MRDFISKEIVPHIDEWERNEGIPLELFRKVGKLGYFGLKFPEQYGGGGEDYLGQAIWVEELARCGCGGVSGALGAHAEIALPPVSQFGNKKQIQEYLIPGMKGEKVAALGITEPDAGSDVASISTRADRDNGCYIVNGTKMFITNGIQADFVVLAVKTLQNAGNEGISLLLVEKGTPGFSVGRKLEKLGWRSSDTAELVFQDCRVPVENLLGEENQGFVYIMQNFQWERLVLALSSVAGCDDMLKQTIRYLNERKQFGRNISSFQAIQHRLADLVSALEAARQLCYSSLIKLSRGEDILKESTMAKLFACETSKKIADECLQFHGGYGYMMEYSVQRFWRDERLNSIGGGTSEIMRQIIANNYIN